MRGEEALPVTVEVYETTDGNAPFIQWLRNLKDIRARAIIRTRINRIRVGNWGLRRSLGDGVWELKVDFGPGYRVYYGHENQQIVLLLVGGDKRSQARDIEKAKEYWNDFKAFKRSRESAL